MMQDFNGAAIFQQEAEDLLSQIEEVVLDLDPNEPASEGINQLFRAFHTIKGSGHMFGFEAVAKFTHHVESALDMVRAGSLPLTQELLDAVLSARDCIRTMIASPDGLSPQLEAETEQIISALQLLSAANAEGEASLRSVALQAEPAQSASEWRIEFRPRPSLIACGMNPGSVLSDLAELGELSITAHCEDVPKIADLQPDTPYIWWSATLRTDAELGAIRNVFLFVEDDSDLLIQPVQAEADGPILADAVRPATENNRAAATSNERKPSAPISTVRVASDKLDRLVNLVGELVMNQSRLTQSTSRVDDAAITAPVEEIERLVSELRDCVLGIRMMPIGSTFSRFKRLVHDVAAELNKDVALVTEGAETELDKTVLDQIGDPLVHLIRNSMDHGIESREDRFAKGKPANGTVRLVANHVGSNVVIGIHDDGRGIDPQVIRAKAIQKGLLAPDSEVGDADLLSLIFAPGFSTAKEITNLSGRGVGMDVVKRQIEALRGTVSVSSEVGLGTSILLKLPLTLAIIDGLLVQVAGDQFIIPMTAVTENVELNRSDRSRNNGRNVVAVRGELVPYVRLRDAFGVCGEGPDIEKIVITTHADQRVGLVVDRVLGSHQTVIQSLGTFYKDIDALSGATIMGDGRVALILDVAGLVRSVAKQ